MKELKLVTALDAVTGITVSTPIQVRYAKKITLALTRANHTAGQTIFRVQPSIDGDQYEAYAMLIPNSSRNYSQEEIDVTSVTLTTGETKFYALDLEHFGFESIQIYAEVVTDGDATCKVYVEY